MRDLHLTIFSFNRNEEIAVRSLLEDMSASGSQWTRQFGEQAIIAKLSDGRLVGITHRPILAQGNVVAASELAGALSSTDDRTDLYLFYGCAGVSNADLVGSVFLVSSVSYASLGSVELDAACETGERVTLKNKWISTTYPPAASPLQTINLLAVTSRPPLDLLQRTGIPDAHVMATDKVLKVHPADKAPVPLYSGPTGPVYAPGEWTYSQALAQIEDLVGKPVLVEMESYGVSALMRALGLDGRVVILRVTTDNLVGKSRDPGAQQLYLMAARGALAVVVERIIWTEV